VDKQAAKIQGVVEQILAVGNLELWLNSRPTRGKDNRFYSYISRNLFATIEKDSFIKF